MTLEDLVKAYVKEAKDADVIIAEVGAWSNPCPWMMMSGKRPWSIIRTSWIWPIGLAPDAASI